MYLLHEIIMIGNDWLIFVCVWFFTDAKALLDICTDSEREPLLIQEEESALPVAVHRSPSQIPYYHTNEDEEFDNLNDVGLYI